MLVVAADAADAAAAAAVVVLVAKMLILGVRVMSSSFEVRENVCV